MWGESSSKVAFIQLFSVLPFSVLKIARQMHGCTNVIQIKPAA
jgi:hypothetical protein